MEEPKFKVGQKEEMYLQINYNDQMNKISLSDTFYRLSLTVHGQKLNPIERTFT